MGKQDRMVKDIMKNFEWDTVYRVMDYLYWRWVGSNESPTIKELKICARDRIDQAIQGALNPENKISKNEGWSSSSGGFTATAWRTKKYKLSQIKLYFTISEWENSRSDFKIKV